MDKKLKRFYKRYMKAIVENIREDVGYMKKPYG